MSFFLSFSFLKKKSWVSYHQVCCWIDRLGKGRVFHQPPDWHSSPVVNPATCRTQPSPGWLCRVLFWFEGHIWGPCEDPDSELAFVQAKAGAMAGYGLHQQFPADKPLPVVEQGSPHGSVPGGSALRAAEWVDLHLDQRFSTCIGGSTMTS